MFLMKLIWSGLGEVVPARTSPTQHPHTPPLWFNVEVKLYTVVLTLGVFWSSFRVEFVSSSTADREDVVRLRHIE